MKEPVRILVVWGSETNQTQNVMKEMTTKWEEQSEKKFQVTDILEGDEAAEKFEEINSTNYDMIVVGTSSYGDGDPPSGYGKFLYQLYEASKSPDKPFAGMQHAVLGFGSTLYETYQNVPRITDKLLGDAGSRRSVKRLEIDEMEDYDENGKAVEEWSSKVLAAFYAGLSAKDLDSVCDWSEPEKEIHDKKLGPDGFELGHGAGEGPNSVGIALIVGLAGVVIWYYFIKDKTEE